MQTPRKRPSVHPVAHFILSNSRLPVKAMFNRVVREITFASRNFLFLIMELLIVRQLWNYIPIVCKKEPI